MGKSMGPTKKNKHDLSNGFIFIHVPKTGGMSIRNLVAKNGKQVSPHHKSVMAYQEAYDVNLFNRIDSYAVMRNPLDRAVSAYFYGIKRKDNGAFQESNAVELFSGDFDSYVKKLGDNPKFIRELLIAIPQVTFITDSAGNVPVIVYPFEYLGELASHLTKRYLREPVRLIKANQSKHDYFMDYYTPETERIILDLYAEDVTLYEKYSIEMIERTVNTTEHLDTKTTKL